MPALGLLWPCLLPDLRAFICAIGPPGPLTLDNVKSPTGKPVAIRFNVENVLDTNYWSMVTFNTRLNVGTPRTFRLALTADF